MTARILAGSVFDMLPTITPGSVDCVVTSPPYWMLRSYLPKDHELKAQELGSEPTVQEFIANMVRVFGLVRETMADHAVCFVNVGDTYSGSGAGGGGNRKGNEHGQHDAFAGNGRATTSIDLESGNLCLIPQRLAIALQEDGWICRSVIVWHKPAPMPASVSGWRWTKCRVKVAPRPLPVGDYKAMYGNGNPGKMQSDINGINAQWSDCPGCEKCEKNAGLVLRRGSWRPTSSWEPILMLAKSPNYYADGEAVKTPGAGSSRPRRFGSQGLAEARANGKPLSGNEGNGVEWVDDPSGANPRDVQTWAAEPLKEKHYAAFPTALVRFCLRAGTSLRGYCPTCGAPWARVVETPTIPGEMRNRDAKMGYHPLAVGGGQKIQDWREENPSQTLGWRPTCKCCPEQEPRPGLVLDPFSGSARTGLTAIRMGLDYVGVELSPIYCELSRKLLNAENPLFNRVESE